VIGARMPEHADGGSANMSQDAGQSRYAGRSLAGGRYQLRDLLGQGGMAAVHLAYDSVLDRMVAVKTLDTKFSSEQSFRERFRREAQAVAKLTHTNIVSVFDTGEDELDGISMPYIVMELVDGSPLGSVLGDDIRQYGAMPADKALQVTADVLAALDISHEMGLVHRDIKPGNVMVTKRGVVKVMDFGIARAMQSGVTSMTQTGMVVGTPQYLSPEQALGRGVDARSDLYSVGIMLFQLVSGRLPFEADSALSMAYAHVQEEPVAPSSINQSLPPGVDAIVARALKKNPNERFPTAEAMRDECLRVARSLQPVAPSIVPGARTGSGAGFGATVFPPLDPQQQTGPPQGGSVQTPYPPQQYPQQPPQQPQNPGPYGPATPLQQHPQQGYGYPAPATPPPSPYGMPVQQGYQAPTPPPYTIAPQQDRRSGGGRKGNARVVIACVAVAAIAILGARAAINFGSSSSDNTTSYDSSSADDSTDDSADAAAGSTADAEGSSTGGSAGSNREHKGPDVTRTIDAEKCSDPDTAYDDENKVQAPNFEYKDITSVKACLQAAGWKVKETKINENIWGEGTVISQFPTKDTDIDPDNATFNLQISTGDPE
jgi:serine/threonine protein kinase